MKGRSKTNRRSDLNYNKVSILGVSKPHQGRGEQQDADSPGDDQDSTHVEERVPDAEERSPDAEERGPDTKEH